MKKVLAIFVAAVVGVTSTFAVSSSAFADDVSMSQEQFIEKADEFVEVTDDGLIELELPDKLVDAIEPEEYEQIMTGIATINEAVENGELTVTPNGTIYETDDEELVVQGGNVNKSTWHWWGFTMYLDHNNAKTMAYDISIMARCLEVGGTITGCAAKCASINPLLATLLKGLSAGMVYARFQLVGLSSKINYYNDRSGVVADVTWLLTYSVKSQ